MITRSHVLYRMVFLAFAKSLKHATLDKLVHLNDLSLCVWVSVSVFLQLSDSLITCPGFAKPLQMPLEIMSSPLWRSSVDLQAVASQKGVWCDVQDRTAF